MTTADAPWVQLPSETTSAMVTSPAAVQVKVGVAVVVLSNVPPQCFDHEYVRGAGAWSISPCARGERDRGGQSSSHRDFRMETPSMIGMMLSVPLTRTEPVVPALCRSN